MSRHTASEARRELFRLLDSVERGEEVILERRGVAFRLSLEPEPDVRKPTKSPLRVVDDTLLDGVWSWDTNEKGELTFSPDEEAS